MLKQIIIRALHYSGFNYLVSLLLRRKLYLINFHSICSADNEQQLMAWAYPDLTMSAGDLEQRLKYLVQRGHTFITFADLASKSLRAISRPTILYFDDGFRDNLINALPLLQRYGARATFFITTGLISRSVILWTIQHRFYLRQKGYTASTIETEIKKLRRLPARERTEELQRLYQRDGFQLNLTSLPIFLSWDEVRQLSAAGMAIGSHGVLHGSLSGTDSKTIIQELETSRQQISQQISRPVLSFSFPYGRFSPDIIQLAAAAGYRYLVSAGLGLNALPDPGQPLLVLKNILNRTHDSLIDFKVRLYAANAMRKSR